MQCPCNYLLKVVAVRLLVNNIKQRLRAEPSSTCTSNSTVSVRSLLITNLNWLLATRCSRSLSHQLRLTALLQADEPEDSLLDSLTHSQEAVVLEKSSLLVSKAGSNILAFLLSENNTVERIINNVVVVESTSVLSQSVDLAAQRAPCTTVHRVTVSSTDDIRTSGVHGSVDHVCCGVEQAALASIDDLAGVVDQNQVGLIDERESDSEGVDPEAIWVDGVAKSDVAGYTLIETIFAEDAESGRETSFEIIALLVFIVELGRSERTVSQNLSCDTGRVLLTLETPSSFPVQWIS